MKKSLLILAAAALPALADYAPAIPSGPVTYDTVGYESGGYDTAYTPDAYPETATTAYATPETPSSASSAGNRGFINLNLYSTNYQVRGMGFTDPYTDHGYSSLSGSYTLPNRNLFGHGIQQRLGGEYGYIWDHKDIFGDTPLLRFDYAIGKEIFPNLLAEVGYSLHHGGAEGYLARANGDCPHRLAEDLSLRLTYNDHQKGFFGHGVAAWGFQGLTGTYYDAELGYRFTNVLSYAAFGTDLELSAGIAPSLGYWEPGAEGVDAYRLKAALPVFTHTGSLGHDSRWYVTPWASWAWSGCNARKIDRRRPDCPIDHYQFTLGVDCGYRF